MNSYETHVTITEKMINCNKKGCTLCPHPGYYYGAIRYGYATSNYYIGKQLRLSLLKLNKDKSKWEKFL
jgi:hypothetical protein